MIHGLYGTLTSRASKSCEKNTQTNNIAEIHKNRIKNEIERLRLGQCKVTSCLENNTNTRHDNDGKLHFHVDNVTMYDKTSKNYILIEISLVLDNLDSFNTNVVPIEIMLYKDFPFSFPDIIFPTTCCFPSLSDGRSFTVEILNNSEWSPSTTLLDLVGGIQDFLISYNRRISTVGTSDLYIGSYRSPISFNYQCSNSLIYPILESSIKFSDEVYNQIIDGNLILKSNGNINKKDGSLSSITGLISQSGKSIVKSLVPIPLNTSGIARETLNLKFEKPCVNFNFVFNNTNIMLFDSVLLIIENNSEYYGASDNNYNSDCRGSGGIINTLSSMSRGFFSKKSQKVSSSSSSDEILSDSSLCGNVVLWFYLSTVTHILDNTGKLVFGSKGTIPEEITEKISKLEYSECVTIVIGYDLLHEKSSINFYFQNELIKVPKNNRKPIIIRLKFHNNKAKHENSCCLSFANNIKDKVNKIGNYFPNNCYNPNWDSYFQLKLLENANSKYQNVITSNHVNLCSDTIYRWVVISSKLIELTSFISETDNKYSLESNNLVKTMQQILVSSPVKNILNSHKIPNNRSLHTSNYTDFPTHAHSCNHSFETDANTGPSISAALHDSAKVESTEIKERGSSGHGDSSSDNGSEHIHGPKNETLGDQSPSDSNPDNNDNTKFKETSHDEAPPDNTEEALRFNHIQLREDNVLSA
ncbi:hypothetical protein FG386_002431 [Cryptosporidium ryanae]|uniref:uncharacterized protein n=1 Tax=Cryptosporidium ryanae TaxID=515981 RepID=UPI00351A2EF9|nr:hypothetical protein FG386_002431 [Cryptosporidium ryanae]